MSARIASVFVERDGSGGFSPLDIVVHRTEYRHQMLIKASRHGCLTYEEALRYGKDKACREFYEHYSRLNYLPVIYVDHIQTGNLSSEQRFQYSFAVNEGSGFTRFGNTLAGSRLSVFTHAVRELLTYLNVEGVN